MSVLKNNSTGGTISFGRPADIAAVAGAFNVVIGDLDGDGKPDLAAASAFANSIVVVQNQSAAGLLSFSSAQNFITGSYPVCVAISDVDGDGKPDLVSANRSPGTLSVLRNTGSSGALTFASNVDYGVGIDPLFIVGSDFDGDGQPDLSVANSSDAAVSVLRNQIGANNAPGISSFSPTAGFAGTVVKIVGTHLLGVNYISFGGIPASSFVIDSATGISATVAAGNTGDVLISNSFGRDSLPGFVFNGPTITSFTPATGKSGTFVTITGTNFTGTTAVKFGGVNAASFIVNSSTSITATVGAGAGGAVSVTTPNGEASLQGFSFGAPIITSFSPVSGRVGATIVITGTNFNPLPSGNIVFFGAVRALVTAASTTQLSVKVPAGTTYQPITITSNNLTAYSSGFFEPVFTGNGQPLSSGSFQTFSNFPSGAYPFSVTSCDFNSDGKPELVTVNGTGNSISVLKNTSASGNLSFDLKTDFPTGPDPRRIVTGDFDGDGKPDIAVTNFNSGNVASISLFRNTSAGEIVSFSQKTDFATGNGSFDLAIADLDQDGKPDLLVTSGNSGYISFLKNTSGGPGTIAFASTQNISAPRHSEHIVTADIDNDGKTDFITTNFSGSSISVFRNNSQNGFFAVAAPVDYTVGTNPTYLSVSDIDGDGNLDLAITNYTTGDVSFYRNLSSPGNIALVQANGFTLPATTIAMGDLNGDGKIDLFAGQTLSGKATVLTNSSTGTGLFSFTNPVNFTPGNYDSYTSIGDLDGDGKPDLIIANTLMNSVSVSRNKMNDPVITSLSASSGIRSQTISIMGGDFSGTTAVLFGDQEAASYTVVSPTRIDAVIGSGASGKVTVISANGVASFSGFQFIPEISTLSSLSFCKNSYALLSSTATANNQWYKDGLTINGATDSTFQARTSGVYTVKTTHEGITTASPNSISLTAIVVPAPTVSRNNNGDLESSAAMGNQWYLDGNIIPGASGRTYQPVQNGAYTVKSTIDGCETELSAAYQFRYSGSIDLGNGQFIAIFPNPVQQELHINWNIDNVSSLSISINDLSGNKLIGFSNILNAQIVDLSKLPPGLYLIKFYSAGQNKINKTTKFLKGN